MDWQNLYPIIANNVTIKEDKRKKEFKKCVN